MPVPDQSSFFSDARTERREVNAPANDPFELRYHPDLWELVEIEGKGKARAKSVLIPQLGKDILRAGVNNVKQESDEISGVDCFNDMKVKQEKKGWKYLNLNTVIDAEYLPEGVPAGPYRRETASSKGGVYYHEAWESIEADRLMGGTVNVYDKQGLYRWLHAMVKAGVFGAPSVRAVKSIERQITARRSEFQTSLRIPPQVRDQRIKSIDNNVAALHKAAALVSEPANA